MQVVAIRLSASDVRCFRKDDGYRIGHYLERDKPAPQNTRANLVIYRVPTGTQAPVGRIPDAQLQILANEGLQQVEPEVIARFPYWSLVEGNGEPLDVPDDTGCEPLVVLPPSLRDSQGAYVEPPHAYEPLAQPVTASALAPQAQPVKPAQASPAEAAKPKEG